MTRFYQHGNLPETEEQKQARRLVKAIKSGLSLGQLLKRGGIGEVRIREVACAHGLEIAKQVRKGPRR